MRDDLGVLLRNGGLDIVRKLLDTWKQPTSAIKGGSRTKARRLSVAAFIMPSEIREDKALAKYRYDAARIEALAPDCLDHLLQDGPMNVKKRRSGMLRLWKTCTIFSKPSLCLDWKDLKKKLKNAVQSDCKRMARASIRTA